MTLPSTAIRNPEPHATNVEPACHRNTAGLLVVSLTTLNLACLSGTLTRTVWATHAGSYGDPDIDLDGG